jgi:transcription initiation factor TFIID subunit 7
MVDESEVLEGEEGLGQAQYEADLAGVNMSLDPGLTGLGGATSDKTLPTNGNSTEADTPAYDLSGFADGDTPADSGDGGANRRAPTDLGGSIDGDGDQADGGRDEDGEEEEEEDDEEEEGYDSDLAAMIEGEIGGGAAAGSAGNATASTSNLAGSNSNAAAAAKEQGDDASDSGGSDEEGDSDDLFGKGRSDDDDDEVDMGDKTVKDTEETLEAKRRVRLMADEMKDLENAVNRKKQEVSRAPNPIIKRRFEDSLKKLSSEFELKKAQYAAAQSKLIHVQQEIKRQQAEEDEAAGITTAPKDNTTSGPASSHTLDSEGLKNNKSDPVTVFGSSASGNPGSAKISPTKARDDAMDVDVASPPPLPSGAPKVNKGKARFSDSTPTIAVPADDSNDIQVRDFAGDNAEGDAEGDYDDDDLFGDNE